MPRQSVYSISNSNRDIEVLAAKKRQSITVHNHDFEILEAMRRRSTVNKNRLSVARSDITETIEENQRDPADEKAELGKSMRGRRRRMKWAKITRIYSIRQNVKHTWN